MYKDIRIKVYMHSLTWNLLPFAELNLHDRNGSGWRLSTGWLCITIELDYEFIPF